jgi:TRAP-type C4-dicarboxylate transport system permease large subunit
MFLDTVSIMLITLPIVFPIIQELHFSGIWFGILMIKMCEIGLITPPVGLNVYVISGIAKNVNLTDIFWGSSRFIILEFITLGILILFPQLVLYLPGMMK